MKVDVKCLKKDVDELENNFKFSQKDIKDLQDKTLRRLVSFLFLPVLGCNF